VGHPALIGATAPDGGYTARYLHWSDHPDRLIPVLRQIWTDTFDYDTARMVEALLARDWSSLSAQPRSSVFPALVVPGVGQESPGGTSSRPYRGQVSTVDSGDMEWLYLIDCDTDTIAVYEATCHHRWLRHSVHSLALARQEHVVDPDDTTTHEDDAPGNDLDPGVIVTVTPSERNDEPPGRLFVVIDGFDAPRYTIAVLGGDGYQYPNVPDDALTVVTPAHIVLDPTTTGGYVTG
jgi:hypothetical protein